MINAFQLYFTPNLIKFLINKGIQHRVYRMYCRIILLVFFVSNINSQEIVMIDIILYLKLGLILCLHNTSEVQLLELLLLITVKLSLEAFISTLTAISKRWLRFFVFLLTSPLLLSWLLLLRAHLRCNYS
jgi:hypothetical protein